LRAERLKVQSDQVARASRAETARLALLGLISAPDLQDSLAPTVDQAIRRTVADTGVGALPDLPPLDTLVSQSKRVRLADADVASSRAALALADAGQNPGLLAGIGIQRFEVDGNARLGPTLTATLVLPFTSPGPRRGAGAARMDVRRAETDRIAAAAEVRVAARSAIARYRTARQRLLIYDAGLLRGARDEREAALAAFRTGETSLLELLDFELALMRAEISRLEARGEAIDALADLLSGDAQDSNPSSDREAR
jgi:cobalt-zinc-cadmium efflux system outer membrane protein